MRHRMGLARAGVRAVDDPDVSCPYLQQEALHQRSRRKIAAFCVMNRASRRVEEAGLGMNAFGRQVTFDDDADQARLEHDASQIPRQGRGRSRWQTLSPRVFLQTCRRSPTRGRRQHRHSADLRGPRTRRLHVLRVHVLAGPPSAKIGGQVGCGGRRCSTLPRNRDLPSRWSSTRSGRLFAGEPLAFSRGVAKVSMWTCRTHQGPFLPTPNLHQQPRNPHFRHNSIRP